MKQPHRYIYRLRHTEYGMQHIQLNFNVLFGDVEDLGQRRY